MTSTTTCSLQNQKEGPFDAHTMSNGRVRLTIVPELGGKITSIFHLASGREWLWRNPHLPQKSVVYDASYVTEFDTGGLDECFPAVSGGPYPGEPWAGTQIPDHGELWCQPWDIVRSEHTAERLSLSLTCYGARFPYRFMRTLSMTADSPTITLDYEVENLSNFDFPFIWSSHPLLAIEEGMRITLPPAVDTVHRDASAGGQAALAWPAINQDGHESLAIVPASDFGEAIKLYTPLLHGDEPVETAVIAPDGHHRLAFRFRPNEVTHIGLWLNYGGWSGSGSTPYFNLGLEPCIGNRDDLGGAVAAGDAAVLPAKQTRRWSLQLLVI